MAVFLLLLSMDTEEGCSDFQINRKSSSMLWGKVTDISERTEVSSPFSIIGPLIFPKTGKQMLLKNWLLRHICIFCRAKPEVSRCPMLSD